jgi:hypothetical protein
MEIGGLINGKDHHLDQVIVEGDGAGSNKN